ncbi:MAG TPA: insulinase family protein [Caulobacteraceae bacterium]|jgi:zinc protease|nr:insulinase family protein [Caulobacteraceae bacterium]
MNRFLPATMPATMIAVIGAALATVAVQAKPAPHRAAVHAAAAVPVKRDGVWAQTYSDLPADPNVRFGTLPNGMRYAIMRNKTPEHQASIRLRIGSGALEESDAQQGLAHFLEHMAFKGSTHVPEGDMIKILERKGLAFGPDTNASTGFDQTLFMLDLPETDPDTLSTGLMLMRETASELLLKQSAMDSERGVILSEERLRSTPGYRAQKREFDFILKGQLVPNRFPIGLVQVVKTAPVSLIRSYYEANYRPDRATLVVVGDIDPADIEKRIKAGFSDWKGKGPETKEPNLGQVERRGPETDLVVEPNAPTSLWMAWIKPYDPSADVAATRRRDLIEAMGMTILDRRLERLSRGENPPFVAAQAGVGDFLKSAKLTSLNVSSKPGGWKPALDAAVREQRALVQYGVRQDEIDREMAETRASLQNGVAGANTRRTPDLANAITGAAGDDEVFISPEEALKLFDADAKYVTVAAVDEAARHAFEGNGPVLAMTSPVPVEGGQAAVAAEFAKARSAPVQKPADVHAKTWPYTNFGATGVVTDRKTDDLGVTTVNFANGVRLTVKPTAFRKDQILVSVVLGNGRLDLSRTHVTPAWALGGFVQGGLDQLSIDEMEQVLTGKIYSARLSIGDADYVLSGATRPQDLDLQMQVLAAYATHPGFRPEGFNRVQTQFLTILPQIDATPGGVLARALQVKLHDGDARWEVLPTQAEIEATHVDDLKKLLSPELAGRIDVVVAGDVTVDQAIAAVGKTFAALPPRPAAPPAQIEPARFPAPSVQPTVMTHNGRPDQAEAVVAWPTESTYPNTHESRVLSLAESILENRLIDQVRIAEGATYSPQAGIVSSQVFPGYGYVDAAVETPPEKIPGFFADVTKISADMASKGVTADELERARKPLLERYAKDAQTNEYWLRALSDAQSDPRRMELYRNYVADLNSVTADEIKKAAQRFFVDNKAWRLEITPKAAAPAASK